MKRTPQFLITSAGATPFFDDYFDAANNFNLDCNMTVYDLRNHLYTTGGETWNEIEINHW